MARVLVIDDMPPVRRAIATLLRDAGHDVEEAGDGAAGLACACAQRFDLVVTDILMPVQDGTVVLMALAEQPARPRLLAVSGGSGALSESDALRLARLKADATLAKPFDRDEFLAVVSRLIGSAAQGRA